MGQLWMMGEIVIPGEQRTQLANPRGHDLENRLVGIRRHFLFEMSDPQRLAVPDLTLIGNQAAGDHAEQSCLAGTVAADQADALAGVDLELDASEQRHMAVSMGDIIEAQQWH